jgi:hypothetical protein
LHNSRTLGVYCWRVTAIWLLTIAA